MSESTFKRRLIEEIQAEYPGVIILKNDASFLQGIPDHLILYKNQWAAFEAKAHENSRRQPNQEYYINLLNEMSLASFVFPENKEYFLNELQRTFGIGRRPRFSRR